MHLFINGDSRISAKLCSTLELLPHDVVEHILERLAAKSLMRFKAVSKQWKSMIESRFFQERQLMQCKRPVDPHVLMVSEPPGPVSVTLRTFVVGSSSSFKIPTLWETDTYYLPCRSSCDGLVCLYSSDKSSFVLNPITKWSRTLPPSRFQQLDYVKGGIFFRLGFGKDKFRGIYKPVWLYNSIVQGRENVTTCEVFDFSTNAWRYITPAAPYQVLIQPGPVYVDGSLHWFTLCEETKVISLDLHTEDFQVISKSPVRRVHGLNVAMCNLDNRLCVAEKEFDKQVIWCFNSDNKTWDIMYSIHLKEAIRSSHHVLPLAVL